MRAECVASNDGWAVFQNCYPPVHTSQVQAAKLLHMLLGEWNLLFCIFCVCVLSDLKRRRVFSLKQEHGDHLIRIKLDVGAEQLLKE